MKKKIISILALVLVIVTAMVLCTSCAKKEEAKETVKISITIVNKTGEDVKDLTLKEQKGSQEWSDGKLANDQEITMTVDTVSDNGAPFLNFSYALENGSNVQTSILTKGDKIITLTLDENGSPNAEIAEK